VTVGLLGGAFDPPHNAHVVLAREGMRHFHLTRLIVVVTGTPPHKPVMTDAETRYRLAAAAFAGMDGVELSRHELERPGPSYTVDTARWARDTFGDVVLLIGADEFASFLSWRDPDGVVDAVRLGVATRPGYPRERLDEVLARLRRPDRVELFEIPELAISSTDVRARIAAGEAVDDLVPSAVARLVDELGLYRAAAVDRSTESRLP
jgi:nicotinate-nucleotide adenylyltransferase